MKVVRIGSGAGYSGDRIEPAVELVERGNLDFIGFECLSERTIALAQAERQRRPDGGFDPLLERRMAAILPAARANGVRIITNMGAANPEGAARAVAATAAKMGIRGLRIAAVLGDDVEDVIRAGDFPLLDRDGTSRGLGEQLISANAYLGVGPIIEALERDVDVVITGRVGDPAIFLAPLIYTFGWAMDDWTRLARGTLVGHLLECAGQITGGYFADPGVKDVKDLARLGFPLAEVCADGNAVMTKVAGSGGQISVATCKEQLLYEVLDPHAYIQPDVVSDFSNVHFEALAPDRISVTGAEGLARPEKLKVSIGYRDGFLGEGQISYAGPNAVARGRLALEIVRERLILTRVEIEQLDVSLIGVDSVDRSGNGPEPREVRVRVAGRARDPDAAQAIGREVEALYTNGPAGGGGAWKSDREIIAVASTLIDRELVRPRILFVES